MKSCKLRNGFYEKCNTEVVLMLGSHDCALIDVFYGLWIKYTKPFSTTSTMSAFMVIYLIKCIHTQYLWVYFSQLEEIRLPSGPTGSVRILYELGIRFLDRAIFFVFLSQSALEGILIMLGRQPVIKTSLNL